MMHILNAIILQFRNVFIALFLLDAFTYTHVHFHVADSHPVYTIHKQYTCTCTCRLLSNTQFRIKISTSFLEGDMHSGKMWCDKMWLWYHVTSKGFIPLASGLRQLDSIPPPVGLANVSCKHWAPSGPLGADHMLLYTNVGIHALAKVH